MPSCWSQCARENCDFRCVKGLNRSRFDLADDEDVQCWLVTHHMVPSAPTSSNSSHSPVLMVSSSSDRGAYRCPVNTCRRRKSFRHGFFMGHLAPKKLLKLLYFLSRQSSVGDLVHEEEVASETAANFVATVCAAAHSFNLHLMEKSAGQWGQGKDDWLQCDETVVRGIRSKHADMRGRKRKSPQWLCGMCEVDSRSGKTRRVSSLHLLPKAQGRKSALLVPAIVVASAENSLIATDELRSYCCLPKLIPGATHKAVCHSREFVSADGIHTNNIERVWGAVKDILRNIWPRNWAQGGDQLLCDRANLAILLHNASLASVDPFVALLRAVMYCQKLQ